MKTLTRKMSNGTTQEGYKILKLKVKQLIPEDDRTQHYNLMITIREFITTYYVSRNRYEASKRSNKKLKEIIKELRNECTGYRMLYTKLGLREIK